MPAVRDASGAGGAQGCAQAAGGVCTRAARRTRKLAEGEGAVPARMDARGDQARSARESSRCSPLDRRFPPRPSSSTRAARSIGCARTRATSMRHSRITRGREAGREPAETHRGLGLIYRSRKQRAEARASFERYLEARAQRSRRAFIKTYIAEPRRMKSISLHRASRRARRLRSVAKVEKGDRAVGERLVVAIDGPWNHVNAPGHGPRGDVDDGRIAGRPTAALFRAEGR